MSVNINVCGRWQMLVSFPINVYISVVCIMSTKTVDPLLAELDEVDKKKVELECKLPFYKRWYRRYLTGAAFASWQISSIFTWIKAGFTMKFLFGGKALASVLATKYPVAYGLVSVAWEKVVVVSVAVAAVAKELAPV
jgi:hypothetical protein